MANIFKAQQQVNDHPNRNNFDLSKKSNVSLKFGTLYPLYCQPVVPGDSFSIDTAFNLKLMPVVFPVQTKMRAHMHYFYVRNKNVWSNWENWISNLVGQSEHPHPYISLPDSDFKNGSIHDYLGVPTSLFLDEPIYNPYSISYSENTFNHLIVSNTDLNTAITNHATPTTSENLSGNNVIIKFKVGHRPSVQTNNYPFLKVGDDLVLCVPVKVFENFPQYSSEPQFKLLAFDGIRGSATKALAKLDITSSPVAFTYAGVTYAKFTVQLTQAFYDAIFDPEVNTDFCFALGYISAGSAVAVTLSGTYNALFRNPVEDFYDYSKLNLDLYSNYLHINALPYRAYESIYYAYYNNNVLNPLTISGQVQYNRYNTELGDGADTTPYHLFQRNYELDFLTSALPSPQQGVAPVVGMTALGDVTIEDENGITTAHAEVDNDGTITKVVLTSPAASTEHARTAMNIAACGMSINDFRSTNALQRVLETNIRKGYRYMDFIAGHFGKEPEYRELDMPEFIGGFSRDVQVSTVVSNADTLGSDSGAALGEYGGYAQVVGGSNHSVRHYCDDYGFIIGILSVVPTPCYSQLLPKHMIAPDNFLDYYFPEMSQLGLQPITYKEVSPIQSFIDARTDESKSLEDTFGYQRPNYDMVSAVDELHGEFRGSLKDYVINRQFDTRPELGQSFISINPAEINDIFVDTNPDEDKIIGEIGFSVHAKRPVPRVVIPNLGR